MRHVSPCSLTNTSTDTELAGKKELENYQQFLSEYSSQLKATEDALDDSLREAWDFTLDPITLQVCGQPCVGSG